MTGIDYDGPMEEFSPGDLLSQSSGAGAQLVEFFRGERRVFELPYRLSGSGFQRRVWQQIALIPFGETRTYGDLARAIGQPGASRAVGAACGQNPVSIVVPCHRVVGAGDRLTGYAGGLDRKKWLLEFEARQRSVDFRLEVQGQPHGIG